MKIALLYMPYHLAYLPSLTLTQLKALINKEFNNKVNIRLNKYNESNIISALERFQEHQLLFTENDHYMSLVLEHTDNFNQIFQTYSKIKGNWMQL